jgi:hypothetical protein
MSSVQTWLSTIFGVLIGLALVFGVLWFSFWRERTSPKKPFMSERSGSEDTNFVSTVPMNWSEGGGPPQV